MEFYFNIKEHSYGRFDIFWHNRGDWRNLVVDIWKSRLIVSIRQPRDSQQESKHGHQASRTPGRRHSRGPS